MISSRVRAAQAARRVGRTSGWITQLTQRYNREAAKALADQRNEQRKNRQTGKRYN